MDNNNSNSIIITEPLPIMPLGAILQEAGLISNAQIQVALLDQIEYEDLLLGEILALHGWLKQETADFFALRWPELLKQKHKQPMGEYLREAGLLTDEQIKDLLGEQEKTLIRFGALAVIKGYLRKNTIDFFIKYLYPDYRKKSAFISRNQEELITTTKQLNKSNLLDRQKGREKGTIITPTSLKRDSDQDNLEKYLEYDETNVLEEYLQENDIIWIV